MQKCGSGSAWIQNFFFWIEFNFFSEYAKKYGLDPDPKLLKIVAGSGSGIKHSGSTTLKKWIYISPPLTATSPIRKKHALRTFTFFSFRGKRSIH